MSCGNESCQCDRGNGAGNLLDQNEVAVMLGVSPKTLEYWRWKKVGPKFLKVGRLAKYRQADVESYIESLAA